MIREIEGWRKQVTGTPALLTWEGNRALAEPSRYMPFHIRHIAFRQGNTSLYGVNVTFLRRHLTIVRPFAGSSISGSSGWRPWAANICPGVRMGTSGKTGRPPGRRTLGARER